MTAETTAAEGTAELTPYGIAMEALERIVDAIDDTLHRTYEDVREIASDAHRRAVLRWQGRPDAGEPAPATPVRYALVEQMGHRSTVASIRETTFCGKQMIEATDLKGGGTSLISPESIYEITWLTEDQALARTRPWTAVALPAGGADADPWPGDEDDQDAEPAEADL